jgi:hypothetical protein
VRLPDRPDDARLSQASVVRESTSRLGCTHAFRHNSLLIKQGKYRPQRCPTTGHERSSVEMHPVHEATKKARHDFKAAGAIRQFQFPA